MNQWMKRALGVAVLGGGLLAFSAGAAAAEDLSAGASARLGGPTAAEVGVCANGQVLSRLLGSCSGQGTSGSAHAGNGGVRARVGVPGTASADVSVGIRRSRPPATASGRATVAPRSDGSPRARASVQADVSRPRSGELLDLRPLADLAGIGVLGSSLFTLAEATLAVPDLNLPTIGLPELTDPAPGLAGIGVLGSGPIASGNQVDTTIGDVAPSVPVTVCGNGVGVLGDALASCGNQPTGSTGSSGGSAGGSAGTGNGTSTPTSLLGDLGTGNQVDAGIGGISPNVPVTVCGNSAGVVGDASASCGSRQTSAGGATGSTGATAGGSTQGGGAGSGNGAGATVDGSSPTVPVTVCGNGVGLLGDTSVSCGQDTSTGGITGPPVPGTTGGSDTSTGGITAPGPTGTTGTTGLTPGTSGGPGGRVATLAAFRPLAPAGSDALPFTGGASDLLALVAVGLLAAGALFLRAARPAVARMEGGGGR